jgi:molybdopterin converting factor subunit 1
MQVRTLLFAQLREASGRASVEVELAEGSTVEDLLASLESVIPSLAVVGPATAVAVNQAYADRSSPLADGDEVALIPPVAGG